MKLPVRPKAFTVVSKSDLTKRGIPQDFTTRAEAGAAKRKLKPEEQARLQIVASRF